MLGAVLLLPLVLAPTAMVLVTIAERRLGPAAAGWLNAIPLSITIAILAVTADRGTTAGAAVAEAAAAHVPAQVAFAVAFAAVLRKPASLLAGLAAATGAFVLASLLIALVPAPLAIAAALPALLAGRRLLAGDAPAVDGGGSAYDTAIRAGVALTAVMAVLTTVRAVGPTLGGAVAAYPALTATLAATVGRARGPQAAAGLLRGVVQGLAGYLAFCVALATTAPALGIATAGLLAVTACALAYAATWSAVRAAPAQAA